jgi:hypothetical protein
METPKLDQLIKMYKEYDSKNYLTDEEKEQMNEFLAIKQALHQPLVISSFCKCKGGAVGRTVTADFEHQICDKCGNIAK